MNTKPKYFKAWVIFFAYATVGGFIAGATVGAIAGMAIGVANGGDTTPIQEYAFFFKVAGFIAASPVSFLIYRWSVNTYIIPQLKEPTDTIKSNQEAKQTNVEPVS